MTVIKLPPALGGRVGCVGCDLTVFMQLCVQRAWLPEGFCSLTERVKIHLGPSPASCPRPKTKAEVRGLSAYCLLGEETIISVVVFNMCV